MPDCESYTALINTAVDGDLLPEERARLMEHLASCPACREIYGQMMAIHTAFASWEEEAPPGLTEAVMNRIHTRRRHPRRWLSLGVAAACCAVVLLGTQVLPSLSPKNNTARDGDSLSLTDEEGDSQNSPADALVPSDADDASEPQVSDPPVDPTLKAALTYFSSGEPQAEPADGSGGDEDQATSALYTATLTCEDAAMAEWMALHIQDEAYVSTDSGEALSAFAWLISYADYTELTAYLAENAIPYRQESSAEGQSPADGDMIRVVYLAPADTQP